MSVSISGDGSLSGIDQGFNIVGIITASTGVRITDGGLVVTAGVTTFNNNVVVNSGSYVGIGTSINSSRALDVFGSSRFTANTSASTLSAQFDGSTGTYTTWLYNGIPVGDVGTGNQVISGLSTNSFAITSRQSQPLIFGTNVTERARIDANGNLGIGSTNPQVPLTILADSNTSIRIDTPNTTKDASFRIFHSGTQYTNLQAGSGVVGGGTILYTVANAPLILGTNNSERLRIDSSGNIGIGTINPVSKLAVYGASRNFNDGQNAIRIEHPGSPNAGETGGGLVFSQHWFTGATDVIRTGGIYGVKTGGSGIFGGGLSFYTQPHNGNIMEETMRLTGTALVGIGSTTPGFKLTVDQATNDGNLFNLKNEEVGLIAGTWGTGSTYPREATLNASRFDSGTPLPALRLAGQGGIKFAVDLNTVRMEIDSSGRVTMPYQPCFYCDLQGIGLNSGFTSGTVVPFTNAITNVGSNFNTSNYRFIAPIEGRYIFHVSLGFGNNTTNNTWVAARFRKNGSVLNNDHYFLGHVSQINGNQYDTVGGTVILNLAANDYVDVTANFNIFNGNLSYGSFCGSLLS